MDFPCVVEKLIAGLCSDRYVVLDGFLGTQFAVGLRDEVKRLHDSGELKQGELAGTDGFWQIRYDDSKRNDKVKWIYSEDQLKDLPFTQQYTSALKRLVAEVKPNVAELASFPSLDNTTIMLATYPEGGSHFCRHIDNPNDNGRVLTFVYYLNENWVPSDGGVLRVYDPAIVKGEPEKYVDVEPLMDRLIVFYSDGRNPHEVLPAHSTRYAATLWFSHLSEEAKISALKGAFQQWMKNK